MYSALALTPVLIIFPLTVFIVPVLFRLLKPCQTSDLTVEWYESFNISCYQPMQGLLAPEDFRFLSSQPGFDPSLCRKLRRDRLRIFRQYLNRLVLDFNRLHALAHIAVAKCEDDHSELFTQLLSIRLRFSLAILKVEISYLLCRFGVQSISVVGALQRLDELSYRLTSLPQTRAFLVQQG